MEQPTNEKPPIKETREIKYTRFTFAIEIPTKDAQQNPIDTRAIQNALYRQFGWPKGSVRLLVAEIENPNDPEEFRLFKSKGLTPQ